jgi:hypothetical protein
VVQVVVVHPWFQEVDSAEEGDTKRHEITETKTNNLESIASGKFHSMMIL